MQRKKFKSHKKADKSSFFIRYKFNNPNVAVVIIARLVAALMIFVWPWEALLLTYILDFIDCYFWMQRAGLTRSQYHDIDKVVDWAAYIVEFIVAIQYGLGLLFSILFAIRLAGQILFMIKQKHWIFIVFPNLFEIAFMWLIAAPVAGITTNMSDSTYWSWFFILVIARLVQEVWLHYLWPVYLKKHGFPKVIKSLGYRNLGF